MTTAPVAILYQALPPPLIDGLRKDAKPGGYSDGGADIAFALRTAGVHVVTPTSLPDPSKAFDWVFPDTVEGIRSAGAAGASVLWANTVLFEGHPLETVMADLDIVGQLDRRPIGYTISDYAICISAARPLDDVDFDQLFSADILGDDLEAWLVDTFMVKRSFRDCAEIAGLIDRRLPGLVKTGRQVTFSTDLIYDVLRRYQPDHLLLRCARDDVAGQLIDRDRLAGMLARIGSRIVHRALDRLSPFSVPAMIALNPEPVNGDQDDDLLLIEAADRIAATAMAPVPAPIKRAARPRSVSRGRLS